MKRKDAGRMPKNTEKGSGPAVLSQDPPVDSASLTASAAKGSWRFDPGGYSPPESDPTPKDDDDWVRVVTNFLFGNPKRVVVQV